MNRGVVRQVAALAASVDGDTSHRIGQLLNDAEDARRARRTLERHLPVALASAVIDCLEGLELEVVRVAWTSAVTVNELVRRELGTSSLVWTGPDSRVLEVRETRATVLGLIRSATVSLTLVTYAGHDVRDLLTYVDEARLERQVRVRCIVETREDSNDRQGPDPIAALGAMPRVVPIYRWPRGERGQVEEIRPDRAAMHAKCVVRDRQEVLVTSANLTSAAMDRNMELGVLHAGGQVPAQIEAHFDDLIEDGVLVPVNQGVGQ